MNEDLKQETNENHTMRWHINEKYEQRQMTISEWNDAWTGHTDKKKTKSARL